MSFWSGLLNVGKGILNTATGAVTGGAIKIFKTDSDKATEQSVADQQKLIDSQIELAKLQGANQATAAQAASNAQASTSEPFDLNKLLKLPDINVNASPGSTSNWLKWGAIIGGGIFLLSMLTRPRR